MTSKISTFFAVSALVVAAVSVHIGDHTTSTVQAHSSMTTMHIGEVAGTYRQVLKQIGGRAPYHWSLATGSSLPEGLTLKASTGVVSGIPTKAGTTEVRFNVTDSSRTPLRGYHVYSIKIVPEPLTFESVMLPRGIAGKRSSNTLVAHGGTPPYVWSVASGSLPDGIKLDPATGVLSGIAMEAKTSAFTVRVKDSAARSELGWNRLQTWSQGLMSAEELSAVEQ